MRGLLAGKEALKAFYARYSAFVNAFLRFITAFAAVFLINQNIGLMPKLSGGLVPLFAGIICAFLPFGAIAFLIGIFLLAQLFAASMLTGSLKRTLPHIHGDYMLSFSAFYKTDRDESMIRPHVCRISFCYSGRFCGNPFQSV